ncbi:MAG: hypothetical protein AAGN66_10905 [Acidobacteriota bacterium]
MTLKHIPEIVPRRALAAALLTGYNEDVTLAGQVFHVQTENYVEARSPRVETQVYREGHIVASKVEPWTGDASSPTDQRRLAKTMLRCHKAAIQDLVDDQLPTSGLAGGSEANGSESQRPPALPKLGMVEPKRAATLELDLRRATIRFSRAVGTEVPGDLEDLLQRLRSVLISLGLLLSKNIESLRQGDLKELEDARARAIDLLREIESLPPEQAFGLWWDFARLAQGFARINDRVELVYHDHKELKTILRHLEGVGDPNAPVNPEVLEDLKRCWGRDQALDELVQFPHDLTTGSVATEVKRVVTTLHGTLTTSEVRQQASRAPGGDGAVNRIKEKVGSGT